MIVVSSLSAVPYGIFEQGCTVRENSSLILMATNQLHEKWAVLFYDAKLDARQARVVNHLAHLQKWHLGFFLLLCTMHVFVFVFDGCERSTSPDGRAGR